jgi:CBS domain-containing protein
MKRELKSGPSIGDLDDTPVSYSMTEGVVTLRPSASVAEVARVMAKEKIHSVVVANPLEPGQDPRGSWGVISDLDLLAAARTPEATAGSLAASPSLTVSPEESLGRVARLMRDYQASHVLVVGFDGVPLGVVSTLDVARVLAKRLVTPDSRPLTTPEKPQ